jgi:DNA-binding SARP family transcriptional activator
MDLEIHLLGFFQLASHDRQINTINQPRLQSLLAYILLNSKNPIPRQHLAFLFWPDLPEAQARNNLRQGLHQLRQLLPQGEEFLRSDANTVEWLPAASVQLDVDEFHQALAAARSGSLPERQADLEQALAGHRGELMPACYDDWILPQREKLHQECLQALEALIQLLEEQRRFDKAIPYAQRLIQHEPLYENGYRLLMQLYALNEDRAGALRTYHACVDILQQELGVEPEPATYEAYQRLLNQTGEPANRASRQKSACFIWAWPGRWKTFTLPTSIRSAVKSPITWKWPAARPWLSPIISGQRWWPNGWAPTRRRLGC